MRDIANTIADDTTIWYTGDRDTLTAEPQRINRASNIALDDNLHKGLWLALEPIAGILHRCTLHIVAIDANYLIANPYTRLIRG